jgi:hypothetical protein
MSGMRQIIIEGGRRFGRTQRYGRSRMAAYITEACRREGVEVRRQDAASYAAELRRGPVAFSVDELYDNATLAGYDGR